jgi:cholesterol oxidase
MTPHCSLRFTEEMKGSFVFGAEDSGPDHAPAGGPVQPFMFHLTISTDDLAQFVQDDTYEATAVGWVNSDALGGRLPVEKGIFNLFVSEGPYAKRMLYRLFFSDAQGHPLTMAGYKEISGGPFSQVWPETTTLYIRLLRGHVMPDGDSSADPVGAGVLHVLPLDFAKQLTTFRAGRGSPIDRVRALVDFGDLFAGQLLDAFWPLRRHRVIR